MPDVSRQSARRICAVLPTYNNAATLARVIEQVHEHVKDVIVVNDGSTDGTSDILKRFPCVTVVNHEVNEGKGAALRDGFARAKAMGFTHAVTSDTDGQHVVSVLPRFLAAIADRPDACVIGVRDLAGAGRPFKSRLLRAHSNFWVWVETGRWVHDTQSGFRAYPLEPIQALALSSRKYDFEIESLVKAMWLGTPVVEVPVSVEYGPGSKSHFRPLADSLLVSRLNAALVAKRFLLPKSLRGVWHLKTFRERPYLRRLPTILRNAVRDACPSPGIFGLSTGVGVFFGIFPIWGFQMAAAVAAAHFLRLSKAVALVASNISFPPAIPVILYTSLVIGRLVLTGHIDYSLRVADLSLAAVWSGIAAYVTGSVILAVGMGIVAGVAAWIAARVITKVWHARACGGKIR